MDQRSSPAPLMVIQPPQHTPGSALASLLFLGVVCTLVGVGVYVMQAFHSAVGGPHRAERVIILPHEPLNLLADQLERQGLVSNGLLFRFYFGLFGGAARIVPGPHLLSTSMTLEQIAQAVQTAPASARPAARLAACCTIPAGWRLEQVAALLASHRVASYQAILHELRSGRFNYWFLRGRPRGATLEGFLYPGYYPAPPHTNLRRLVDHMLAAFDRHFTASMRAQDVRAHLGVYQVVILASIIQRVSLVPDVQRALARVYLNRLGPSHAGRHAGFLGADPTVAYAYGSLHHTTGWWAPRLSSTMIAQTAASPYNTYTHPGLPPGPISNPGASALVAVLQPARAPFRSFLVLPGGKHARVVFCVHATCSPREPGSTIIGSG